MEGMKVMDREEVVWVEMTAVEETVEGMEQEATEAVQIARKRAGWHVDFAEDSIRLSGCT